MNLLCPNCQKMLTVPEQFAGQLMKCPLCTGTFTVPSLPPGSDPAMATASSDKPAQESSPMPPTEMMPPPLPAESSEPAFSLAPEPQPAFAAPPKPEAPKAAPTASTTTASPSASAPRVSSTSHDGYHRVITVEANVRILQWVPVVCIVLITILQFFPWVGVYPGGVRAVSQNAWYAAMGWYDPDPDMKSQFKIITPQEAADRNELLKKEGKDVPKEISNEPGFGPLTFFYLIPFSLATLAFTLVVAAQPYLSQKLPPQVEQLLPYKWAILAGLNVILLLFISLQLLLNFSLETSVTHWIESRDDMKQVKDPTTEQIKIHDARIGNYVSQIRRTTYFRLVVLLHLLSTAAAGLVYWIERRGPSKPLPTFELRW